MQMLTARDMSGMEPHAIISHKAGSSALLIWNVKSLRSIQHYDQSSLDPVDEDN